MIRSQPSSLSGQTEQDRQAWSYLNAVNVEPTVSRPLHAQYTWYGYVIGLGCLALFFAGLLLSGDCISTLIKWWTS